MRASLRQQPTIALAGRKSPPTSKLVSGIWLLSPAARRRPVSVTSPVLRIFRLTAHHFVWTETRKGLLIVHMTTLTITDAKKNLGKCLPAPSQREDLAILTGATVF